MLGRIVRTAVLAGALVAPLGPCAPRALEAQTSMVATSTLTAAAGSFSGLWLGATAAVPFAFEDNHNVGLFYASAILGTTVGGATGAALVNDDWKGSLVGSLLGVGLGYAAAFTVARRTGSEGGAYLSFSLTHGLATALVAEVW